ncbi:hypothetical protein EMIT0111MI5_120107 [Burkholderia sp. IT-111MI5]
MQDARNPCTTSLSAMTEAVSSYTLPAILLTKLVQNPATILSTSAEIFDR